MVKQHVQCCAVTKFSESNCRLVLPRADVTWVALSGTNYQTKHKLSGKLCDVMLFWIHPEDMARVGAFELKGGSSDVGHVAKQLQGGADVIASLTKGAEVEFAPVLVHNRMNAIEIRQLARLRVKFRGKVHRIGLARCGSAVHAGLWS